MEESGNEEMSSTNKSVFHTVIRVIGRKNQLHVRKSTDKDLYCEVVHTKNSKVQNKFHKALENIRSFEGYSRWLQQRF